MLFEDEVVGKCTGDKSSGASAEAGARDGGKCGRLKGGVRGEAKVVVGAEGDTRLAGSRQGRPRGTICGLTAAKSATGLEDLDLGGEVICKGKHRRNLVPGRSGVNVRVRGLDVSRGTKHSQPSRATLPRLILNCLPQNGQGRSSLDLAHGKYKGRTAGC